MRKIVSLALLISVLLAESKTVMDADSIDLKIGQMIMIGIGDFDIVDESQSIFREISEGKAGGVVLYEKNILFENPKSELALMVETLQKNTSIPLFISIDEEGGRVSRMKSRYGFPRNVSAQYLGEMDNLDSTRYYAAQTASLLKSFGINMNYAPVVDININPENPVIGKIERSFSPDYKEVIRQAYQVMDQHNEYGVIPVLKHFPGHGSSCNDTHLGITDVTETWQLEEMYPYRALIDSGIVKAVMTAHIVNQTLDGSKNPATLSKKIVTGMLREFLGFNGVIISDDMQMGAIDNEYGLREAIRLSIDAGVDMLMFANNVVDDNRVTASIVHAIIKDLVFEGIISEDRITRSYNRIVQLKRETGLLDESYYKSLRTKLRRHN